MAAIIDYWLFNKDYPGWEVIPEDARKEFNIAFNKNAKVIDLQKRITLYQNSHDFYKELNARKTLQDVKLRAQMDLLAQLQNKAVKIRTTLKDVGLTDEQMNRVNILMLAVYMACDMIDALCIDINSELRKVDDSAELDMFKPVRELGKHAKDNLTYLWKQTDMFDTDVFNDVSDDMLEILTNKAKKVYRKYIENAASKVKENSQKT